MAAVSCALVGSAYGVHDVGNFPMLRSGDWDDSGTWNMRIMDADGNITAGPWPGDVPVPADGAVINGNDRYLTWENWDGTEFVCTVTGDESIQGVWVGHAASGKSDLVIQSGAKLTVEAGGGRLWGTGDTGMEGTVTVAGTLDMPACTSIQLGRKYGGVTTNGIGAIVVKPGGVFNLPLGRIWAGVAGAAGTTAPGEGSVIVEGGGGTISLLDLLYDGTTIAGREQELVIRPSANGSAGLTLIECSGLFGPNWHTGTTILKVEPSYSPNVGDSWEVVTWVTQTLGDFNGIEGAGGLDVEYTMDTTTNSARKVLSVTVTGVPEPPSVAPADLTAEARSLSVSTIVLSWTATAFDSKIERSTDGGSTWTQIATVASSLATYSDSTVTEGNTYHYRVKDYNAKGDGPASSVVSATAVAPFDPTGLPVASIIGLGVMAAACVAGGALALRKKTVLVILLAVAISGAAFGANLLSTKSGDITDDIWNGAFVNGSTGLQFRGDHKITCTTDITTNGSWGPGMGAYLAVGSAPYIGTLTITSSGTYTQTAGSLQVGFSKTTDADYGLVTIEAGGAADLANIQASRGATAYTVVKPGSSLAISGYYWGGVGVLATCGTSTLIIEGPGSTISMGSFQLDGRAATAEEQYLTIKPSANGSAGLSTIAVTGGINLDESPQLVVAPSYAAAVGDSWDIMTFNGVVSGATGSFAGVTGIPSGIVCSVTIDDSTATPPKVVATVTAIPAGAPSATTVTPVAADFDKMDLSWTDVDAGMYMIERSMTDESAYATIATVAGDVLSMQDSGLTWATEYYYRVTASSVYGAAAASAGASATTLDPPACPAPTSLEAAAASDSQIDLTWNDNCPYEEGQIIEFTTNDDFTSGYSGIVIAADATSYSHTGLAGSTLYRYRIKATHSSYGDSTYDYATEITDATPVGTPVASGLGLGLLAGASALAGAFVIRKK